MTKDEMKNRISMALKDPILQQGFEIICKDLAISEHDKEHNDYELTEVYKKVEQLEKENAELKERNKEIANSLAIHCQDTQKVIDEYEKENAELKIQNTNANLKGLEMQVAKDSHRDRANKTHEQLIKAKEILTKLLEEEKNNMYWEMNGSDKSSYYKVRKEAEQFLSEAEK